MSTQYFCKNKDRWKKVINTNGIDYLEVSSVDQKTLKLFFLQNLPGEPGGKPVNPPLTKDNIFIEGGVRVKRIEIADPTGAVPFPVSASGNVLTIVLKAAGDFSIYTLKIGNSLTDRDTPPPGFDQQLSAIDFSFKINCPNDFDCKTETACPPPAADEPSIDYVAKDYSTFNRLMLDRLSIVMPDWRERNAADLQVALVELMAYVGDHLSYYQDAVATEAYLQTARRRVSLKRHARLLDYFVHDGCNARVWMHIEVQPKGGADGASLDKGTVLLTNGEGDKITVLSTEKDQFINENDPVVFETMHKITLNSAHNLISFYTWEDTDCCLPKGATMATLKDDLSNPITLKQGDVLIFEELYGPASGKKADANPELRHAVRLKKVVTGLTDDLIAGTHLAAIEWYGEDALPFPFCLTSPAENEDALLLVNEKTIARGNIVLADNGLTKKNEGLNPATAGEALYYPELATVNNTVMVQYDHDAEKTNGASISIIQDPHRALPAVSLTYGHEVWNAKRDLLGSDRFAPEFVVEMEQDGRSFLRFGDDIGGKKPLNGFSPRATYRAGSGKAGNVGADTINLIVLDIKGITKARNPMPAFGGKEAETMEEVRQFAPQAFRSQERAVTEADYVQKTELHAEVQKAAAKFYWTGSWYTVYVIIDRKGGREIDNAFKDAIRLHLEQYRMAGYDLEIRAPKFVPLHIILKVCVKPGYFKNDVKTSLLQVFSRADLADGSRGFFHPDNFTFGQPVYLSAIYQKAMGVAGVASVEIKTFKRWAKNPATEIADGILQPSELEILRLDNDPNFPENGKIDFLMFGGL